MKKSLSAFVGFALADAMGVPREFYDREYLDKDPVTDMMGYGSYNVPEGTFSDDSSLMFATCDGIIKTSGVITEDTYEKVADNFSGYLYNGAFTPAGRMFDIGNTTKKAIEKYVRSKDIKPYDCGGDSPLVNSGNGALMRILPIAFYAKENNLTDFEVASIVKKMSGITHRLETCSLGAYMYTKFAMSLIDGKDKFEAYKDMQESNYDMFMLPARLQYSDILTTDISILPRQAVPSSGKTKESLIATLWSFLNSTDYSSAVLTAINLGGDTDTIGALTGGLAGLYYGGHSINKEWLGKLRRLDYIKALSESFDQAIETREIPQSFDKIKGEAGEPVKFSSLCKFYSIDPKEFEL